MIINRGDMNIFGTDGIRGKANEGYITPGNATKLAITVTNYYRSKSISWANNKFTVVIGKDTRLSGYMLEPALTAGFIAAGADVILLGPIPTPAVAFLTRSLRADLGVVISASHNPYQDNGIKFNDANGYKISIEDELSISGLFFKESKLVTHDHMGKARRLDDATGRYIEFIKSTFPKNLTLYNIRIVLDTANGAAYKILPQVLWELGAEVICIGNSPSGLNINKECGAIDTKKLQERVVQEQASIGIAVDGDADRLVAVDEKGEIIDGDYIIAAIATDWKAQNKLKNNTVVVTQMSNSVLEKYFNSIGIKMYYAPIGDKNVVAKMLEVKTNLGGEKNGHIILLDYATSGDGSISALQILSYIVKYKIQPSEIRKLFMPLPQVVINIAGDQDVENTVTEIKRKLQRPNEARVLVRKSGTENLWRVMIEGE